VSANTVLIIDDDPAANADLRRHFAEAGIAVETAMDCLHAMESLRDNRYCAIVLDPIIRERLNGYAVLSYIELEQPGTLARLFLLTGMSKQTIQRTAPALVPRFYRKPYEGAKLADALLAQCAPKKVYEPRHAALLLVEDDPVTGAALSAIVEERGYTVTRAHNGIEALAALASRDYDAILLDLILPEVDGFTVLDQLRATKPYLLQRVIVTTGIPEKYAAGFDPTEVCGVIPKPIDIDELDACLRKLRTPESVFEGGGEYPPMG
jgi:CheY-like chemotaxis protein